jgi:hypothetical protein
VLFFEKKLSCGRLVPAAFSVRIEIERVAEIMLRY